MKSDNQYQQLLRSRVASAITQAKAAASFSHQGVKGSVLEVLISQLFEPLLPADVGIGTGQIIDCFGNAISNQVDIVIYNRAILPPILVDGKLGIFPIESVLYAIEVKTTLTARELKVSHDSALFLEEGFKYLHGMVDADGNEVSHHVQKLRSVIFALKSDLSGGGINEAERYRKIHGDGSIPLRAICVAGSEYWYEDDGRWIGMKGNEPYDEILGFIGGVTNTYKSVAVSRGQPLLGHYVIPQEKELCVIPSNSLPRLKISCQSCGYEVEFVPNFGKKDLTINGRIASNDGCNKCGGKMQSNEGNFIFKRGRLHEMTFD